MSDAEDFTEGDDAPTEDAGDERTFARKLSAIERDKAEAKLFWEQALAHPIGRREIWRIIAAGKPFETTFACGPNGTPQDIATWFHAGAKDISERLFFSLLLLNREGVLLMLDEHDPRFKKPAPPKAKRGAS